MTVPDDTMLLLHAYHDGELSPSETLDMERRLAAEPELRAVADRLHALSQSVKASLQDVPVPSGFEARMLAGLDARTREASLRPLAASWQAMAAALVLGLALGAAAAGGGLYLHGRSTPEPTADAVLAGHLRGLAAPQPFDIASSDRHVVKPWFNGRTMVAPDAPDLADKGFPLVGGRIDVVGGAPVPTLVYRHDRHVISVTVVPGGGVPDTRLRRDGSNIVAWTVGDLTYWVVSDLNGADLRSFTDLFRARLPPV